MFEEVRALLAAEIQMEEQEITLKSSLINDLGIESMDFYCIVEILEEKYQVKIPEDVKIITVNDLVDVLTELKN